MASTSNTTFSVLLAAYPTWTALSNHLTSEEGGKLSVYELHGSDLAMIRYVKDQSNLALPHVGAFRSVVWNTRTNRPVSVTAFKSETGEGFPSIAAPTDILMEEFVDGVLIGQFWDADAEKWRIHTRSMMDAECHYFSNRSFATLFHEAIVASYGVDANPFTDRLEKGVAYSWILQHPENRIVCPVQKPRAVLVAAYRIHDADGALTVAEVPTGIQTPRQYFTKSADATVGRMDMTPMLEVIGMVNRTEHDQEGSQHGNAVSGMVPVDMPGVISMIASMRGSVRYQGVVIKSATEPFRRWKMRTQVYNTVRKLRGNTARRDYHWVDLWSKGGLEEYLKYFPEERLLANAVIQRWKAVTQTVFRMYVDAFKARTLDRSQIPAKFRPLIYGLHNLYMTSLKPARKVLDWQECVRWMNARDTAQKVFVLNWDLRQERQANASVLPLEPQATTALRSSAAAEREEGELVENA